MSTRLYRDLFQYITRYARLLDKLKLPSQLSFFSEHDPFGGRRPNVWAQNVQVAVHKTVEYDVDLRRVDEERLGLPHGDYKQTITVRSQAELELHNTELQMKKDLQI